MQRAERTFALREPDTDEHVVAFQDHGARCWRIEEGIIPDELRSNTQRSLQATLDAAIAGERKLRGKTLTDPKKDSKWERGRSRRAMHFGAHVTGGKAVGAEVEDLPECLMAVIALLRRSGCFGDTSRAQEDNAGGDSQAMGDSGKMVAATIEFFRSGGYTPALAATAPVAGQSRRRETSELGQAGCRAHEASSLDSTAWRQRSAWAGEGEADTEAKVCLFWLQVGGGEDVIVGGADELTAKGKGGQLAKGAEAKPSREGQFTGLHRLTLPAGSVMLWDGGNARGQQIGVPSAQVERILVTLQTLTEEATKSVLCNRLHREKAKEKAARVRRAAQEAREAKAKGPIPGTPIVVDEYVVYQGPDDAGLVGRGDEVESNDQSTRRGAKGWGLDVGRTPAIEREHVQAVYDTIAPHWSHTRYKPWPRVADFLSKLTPFSLVADAGCGNGKYLGCDAVGGFVVGSDTSMNLLRTCRERAPQAEVFASDCMRLPFRDGMFDAAISIAVLHHFSSEARRFRALSELYRLLRPGGKLLVYAWAIEQDQDSRRSFASQDVLVPWHLADHHTGHRSCSDSNEEPSVRSKEANTARRGSMPSEEGKRHAQGRDKILAVSESSSRAKKLSGFHGGRDKGQSPASSPQSDSSAIAGDDESESCAGAPKASAPPRHGLRIDGLAGGEGSVVYQRYCHVYAEGELEELVKRVAGLQVVSSYYDRSNWCVEAQREEA